MLASKATYEVPSEHPSPKTIIGDIRRYGKKHQMTLHGRRGSMVGELRVQASRLASVLAGGRSALRYFLDPSEEQLLKFDGVCKMFVLRAKRRAQVQRLKNSTKFIEMLYG